MIPNGQESGTSVKATPHGNREGIGEGEDHRELYDDGRLNQVVGRSEDGRVNQEVGESGGMVGLSQEFQSTYKNHINN